jgi:hypothetical protein
LTFHRAFIFEKKSKNQLKGSVVVKIYHQKQLFLSIHYQSCLPLAFTDCERHFFVKTTRIPLVLHTGLFLFPLVLSLSLALEERVRLEVSSGRQWRILPKTHNPSPPSLSSLLAAAPSPETFDPAPTMSSLYLPSMSPRVRAPRSPPCLSVSKSPGRRHRW